MYLVHQGKTGVEFFVEPAHSARTARIASPWGPVRVAIVAASGEWGGSGLMQPRGAFTDASDITFRIFTDHLPRMSGTQRQNRARMGLIVSAGLARSGAGGRHITITNGCAPRPCAAHRLRREEHGQSSTDCAR
jgi:hypothetical protein